MQCQETKRHSYLHNLVTWRKPHTAIDKMLYKMLFQEPVDDVLTVTLLACVSLLFLHSTFVCVLGHAFLTHRSD